MYVIGTAGHVDHGKSTLVEALTGIDPDRLAEEKARGMTIELGFAWLRLPSGEEASIVDVPGHERFIKNMLMGVGGIDMALLIVAADEGVMPQTREHLAILDLLEVRRGIAVITKSDLVDSDWLGLVRSDIAEALQGTSLAAAPVRVVSALRHEGLQELITEIDSALALLPPKRDVGRPRLPVDRSFAIAGFGTVVTGTLIDGKLMAGDEVEILPTGRKARIRGVQTHRKPVDVALPGTRVALNLTGVDHSEVARGQVVAKPGWLRQTGVFDAMIRVVSQAPRSVRNNLRVSVHTMTLDTEGTVRLLAGDTLEPGTGGPVQIRLEGPAALVRGDRFIIRDTEATLGGGMVLDIAPPRHRRNDPATIGRLKTLAEATPEEAVLVALQASPPVTAEALARQVNLSVAEAHQVLSVLGDEGRIVRLEKDAAGILSSMYCSVAWWDKISAALLGAVAGYHDQYPLRPGIPREELRNRLGLGPDAFQGLVTALHRSGGLVAGEGSLGLPGFAPVLTPELQARADLFLKALVRSPYAPTTDDSVDEALVQFLADRKLVVRAGPEVVFAASAFQTMLERVRDFTRQRGQVTVQDVRDMFGTSRKYAVPFLEELDRLQITRRKGEARELR